MKIHQIVFFVLVLLLSSLVLFSCGQPPTPLNEERWPTMTAVIATSQALRNPSSGSATTIAETVAVATSERILDATLILSDVSTVTSTPKLPTQTPIPTPIDANSLFVPSYFPAALKMGIELPAGVTLIDEQSADLSLTVGVSPAVSRWVYALVAPFPTLTDDVSLDELRQAWNGNQPLTNQALWVDESTYGIFSVWWGTPPNGTVEVSPSEELLDSAWQNQPSWALIPFELIEPRWKVLTIDGQSPFHKDFDLQAYPLSVPFGLIHATDQTVVSSPDGWSLPAINRDPDKLTIVAMTGVTALVRGTSNTMYGRGITYPAEDVGPWLRTADITHISNEVSFVEGCPLYDLNVTELKFCTNPDYIGLMDEVGTDVVELTGDHFGDQPADAMLFTLDLYHQRGWQTYGGGKNLDDGQKAALFEHNGNKIAFVGCNAKGGGYALASETNPGAAACDFDVLYEEVRRLSQEGYLVIATMQHQEIYAYQIRPEHRADFTGFIDAGATIVQGSQAHQPQNFEFYGDGLIHYGLGNLFFDQIDQLSVTGERIADKAFIDQQVFYDGRYLGVDLLTIQFVDLARPRFMTPEEQSEFLQKIFEASGW